VGVGIGEEVGYGCANAVRWALSVVGVVAGCGAEAAGDEQLASTTSSGGKIRSQWRFILCMTSFLVSERKVAYTPCCSIISPVVFVAIL
jgi:hypothetical protein